MGYGNGEVAKRVRDSVGCVAVSVAGASTEESDRLLAIEDANRQRQPSQTVPVEVARCGDGDPDVLALGNEVLQVVEILYVVENEKPVRCIRCAQLTQEASNNSLRRDVLRCINTGQCGELVEISNNFRA